MNYDDYKLIYMAKENEEAFSVLLKKYEPLFKKLALYFVQKNKYKGLDFEDLVQQCRITLCHALSTYNYDKDILFYSYLIACLKRGLYNCTKKQINRPDCYYMSDSINEHNTYLVADNNIEQEVIDYEMYNLIKDFCYTLKFDDLCVFELRFNGFSYKEIAKLLDINIKKVDNSLLNTRRKLEKFLFINA